MNKSTWIGLLCATIGIVGIIGFTLSRSDDTVRQPLPPAPKITDIKTPTISPEDQKFIEAMKKSEEETEKKKEATIVGIRLFNEAIKTQDMQICEKIEIEEMSQNCKNQVTSALASAKKDPLICNALSGSSSDKCRDTVYFSSAMSQVSLSGSKDEDTQICEKITDPTVKDTCKKKTESVVLEMKQSAKGELSEKDCKEFKDKAVQSDCENRIIIQNDYKILSQVGEDPTSGLCEKIQDESLKSRCADTSVFSQAKKENNASLCGRISNSSFKDQCKKEIVFLEERSFFLDAINSDNQKLCVKITDASLKTTCLDRTRIKKIIEGKDPTQCDIIVDESLRNSCIQSIKLQL